MLPHPLNVYAPHLALNRLLESCIVRTARCIHVEMHRSFNYSAATAKLTQFAPRRSANAGEYGTVRYGSFK